MSQKWPIWEEIRGFDSPGEFDRFVAYLQEHVAAGTVREIPAAVGYSAGMIYGGRWFRHAETGAVWRLVPPDAPFRGLWEPITQSGHYRENADGSDD